MSKITESNYERFQRYSADYPVIPILREIRADIKTPVEVLRILRSVSRHAFLLESLESPEKWGRFTFLGFDPKSEITATNGKMTIRGEKTETFPTTSPNTILRRILEENRLPKLEELPPFAGGLVGYFSFEYFGYSEPSITFADDDGEGFPDLDLMLFDKVIAFDHLRQKIILVVHVRSADGEEGYKRGEKALDDLVRLVESPTPAEIPPGTVESEFTPLFTEEAFCDIVRRGKEYIRRGDIFQVVLSNRWTARFSGSLLDAYRELRVINPSPYLFYLGSDSLELVGASPETLVKVTGDRVETFPLAGSRPRGKTAAEEKRLIEDLLNDPKELAEHNMLVDLGRNDIGRVSQFGTVQVEEYLNILRYSHIMHLGSTVTGRLRQGKDALDALESLFPAGTLSGAPKIRACQIIAELENRRRGVYGGAIGYLDFTGNLDTAIGIRIAFQKNHQLYIRSGAGIVADSVPETEYIETVNKAKACFNAVQRKGGFHDSLNR